MKEYSRLIFNSRINNNRTTKYMVVNIITTKAYNEHYNNRNGSCFKINIFDCDNRV